MPIGDCLLFDPTSCMHAAGVPEKNHKRDYLIVTYVCIPKKDLYINKFLQTNIYQYENNPLLKISKPSKFIKTLKMFSVYYKNKVV